MRELKTHEIMEVTGAGIYTDANKAQFKEMVVTAVAGGLMGGPVGFAVGLVAGAINGKD